MSVIFGEDLDVGLVFGFFLIVGCNFRGVVIVFVRWLRFLVGLDWVFVLVFGSCVGFKLKDEGVLLLGGCVCVNFFSVKMNIMVKFIVLRGIFKFFFK